ncbi:unnamed protein product [Sphagnum balticum]
MPKEYAALKRELEGLGYKLSVRKKANTCTLGVALRYGYDLVAIDHWIGSCAACDEFHNAELDYTNKELTAQSKKMCKELEHIDCPHCDSILWLPDETDYYCDSCARDIPKPAKLKRP